MPRRCRTFLTLAWPVFCLAVAAAMAGCADIPRVAKLERAVEERDDQEDRIVAENARMARQLAQLSQQNKEMAEALDRMARSVTALTDRLANQEQSQADQQRARERRRATLQATRSESSAECTWLGRRAISVLINDDLIAADGFTRLYNDLDCPMEHLAAAFGCAVPVAQAKDRALLDPPPAAKPGETTESAAAARREAQLAAAERRDKRIDSCWKQLKPE